MWWWLFLLLLPVLSGCSGSVDPSVRAFQDPDESVENTRTQVAAPAETTSGVARTPETTVGVSSTLERDAAAQTSGSGEVAFGARPEASGGSRYEADTVLAVRYGMHEDYERVVVDLGTGDDPAAKVPEWTLASMTRGGLLRVTFPSASATGVSDGRFGDGLLKGFYVVRAPEGGMFVDVFVRQAFVYRVLEFSDPARLVVDFKPAEKSAKIALPATGGNTVLVEPRAGARIAGPLVVSGYSRNFEASNIVVLRGADGKVLTRRIVQSNDYMSTWGYFETTLDLPPLRGRGTLQVGAASAVDGSFEGVEIPVYGG